MHTRNNRALKYTKQNKTKSRIGKTHNYDWRLHIPNKYNKHTKHWKAN